jgi:hypothetical protein
MSFKSTIFNQILQIIPRLEFENIVKRHNAEKHSKGFSCWTHFVSMMFAQLSGNNNLRGIANGLNAQSSIRYHTGTGSVNKSTLSYANKHRTHKVFSDVFATMLQKLLAVAPKHKFKFKNPLYSIDSTTIDLCLSLFDWAKFRKTKGGVKLHIKLSHSGFLPTFAILSDAKTDDRIAGRNIPFKKGDVVTFDRGYNDYTFFATLCIECIYFVTRLKKNAKYKVIKRNKVSRRSPISSDQIIHFTGFYSKKNCPLKLRRIRMKDSETGKYIVLLTNNFEWSAEDVGAIYKDRWQIELFFKTMKQKLKIKSFVGTSRNALLIQLTSALIVYLMLSYLKFLSRRNWTIYSLSALIPTVLFSRKDIWQLLNEPFEKPPDKSLNNKQLVLL